uniref:Beta/gamma crystallin 'Greek key' domain-containing protein n=2 Tax=Oncorhynchus TaxID=8016 RepID=A0AAZ3P9G1_ONCTS
MNRATKTHMTSPMFFPGMGMAPFFKVTVFEQEHFQGKCQEFTSECCNIQNCGLDNIRSIRVESGAWVGFEHHDFQGQQFILERGEYPHWDAYSGSLSYHVERLMSLRPIYCASHQSSRMQIFEKENFMGRSAELCDDYPSLRAMGWCMPEVGSMHIQCGAFVCYQFPATGASSTSWSVRDTVEITNTGRTGAPTARPPRSSLSAVSSTNRAQSGPYP